MLQIIAGRAEQEEKTRDNAQQYLRSREYENDLLK